MRCFNSLALAGAFGTLVATAAQAADMAFPPMEGTPAVSEQPVELGTGWYLRGDAGWSRDQVPSISPDGSLSTQSGSTNGYSLDFGFGYKLNNWLRADIVYDYREPQSASATGSSASYTKVCPYNLVDYPSTILSTGGTVPGGYLYNPDDTCNPHGNSELSRQDLLLNGYIDLGTWGGVTPYVGAGAGVALTQSDTSVNWYESNGSNGTLYNANLTPPTGGTVPPVWVNSSGTAISPQPPVSFTQQNWSTIVKSTTYHFAWALMGGFAIDITDHLKLDLGYRYVNFGTLTGTTASGQAVKENQSTQEIRAGFRYMID